MLNKPKLIGWRSYASAATFSFDATTGTLPSGSTFSRASSATYYNSSSLLATATTDTPRFSYDPSTGAGPYLLIEPTATNYLLYSNTLNSTWSSSSGTITNSIFSPDGTNDAWAYTAGTGYNIYELQQLANFSLQWTHSIWASAGSVDYLQLAYVSGPYYSCANFNLANQSLTSTVTNSGNSVSGNLSSATNNWARYSVTGLIPEPSGYRIQDAISNTLITAYGPYITGDGTQSVNFYGGQLEAGSSATSYIPTTTAAATRAADAWTTPTIPAGINYLTFTFDDDSTQKVAVTSGSTYSVPTNLNRPLIKSYVGSAT